MDLPADIPLDEAQFYRSSETITDMLKEGSLNPEGPEIPEIHGITMWFLSPGHDIRVADRRVTVREGSHARGAPLVVEWGPKKYLKCPNSHNIPDRARFCPECGVAVSEKWFRQKG